jgi:hypothetical protein
LGSTKPRSNALRAKASSAAKACGKERDLALAWGGTKEAERSFWKMPLETGLRKTFDKVAEVDAEVNDAVVVQRQSSLDDAIALVGKTGDQPQLRLICAAVTAAGLLRSDSRLFRTGVRMLLAHELATLAKNLVKERVDRTRPRSAESAEDRRPTPGGNRQKDESSFPSGHTAGAVAVATAFSREYPEYRAPVLLAAAIVAGAQVPRRAHYPSDLAAGAVIGAASELLANSLWTSGRG